MNLLTQMMAWYDFEEDYGYGHTIMDKSGRGNHVPTTGTYYLPPSSYTMPGPPFTTWNFLGYLSNPRSAQRVAGKVEYAIKSDIVFAPSNSDFQLCNHPTSPYLDGAIEYTICGWMYVPSGLATGYLVSKGVGAYDEYHVIFSGGATPSFEFRSYNCPIPICLARTVTRNYAAGEFVWDAWYFIVCGAHQTSNGVDAYLYIQINNEAEITQDYFNLVQFYFQAPLSIGCYWNTPNTGQNKVDSVGLWKRILTQPERRWLYNGGSGRRFSDIYVPVVPATARSLVCDCDDLDSYMPLNPATAKEITCGGEVCDA